MSKSLVSFVNATIKNRDNTVFEMVNLEVLPGDFVFLIGKTGSGKSSLIKVLYGDLELAAGQGQLLGFDLTLLKENQIPLLRRKLGVVFQDFKLLPDRSIFDNLAFVLKATGWSEKSKIKARVEEVLQMVNVQEPTAKYPFELSGGEQQRVAIARALLNDPEIILADEPTGNLDPETSQEIMQLFKQLHQKGMTIIMATHDYNMILKFPGKILKCENGALFEVVAKT
ncbi:MAG: cell division ATP-binding protein FtsE [Flavobacteriaceae bacterium]